MSALDATGANAKRWSETLREMTDQEFDKFVGRLESGEEMPYLEVLPFHNEPTMGQIHKAAKLVGVELHQHVTYNHDGKPVRTKEKVPVGYLQVKRLQQLLRKKTSVSLEISRRNQLTGQLAGDSAVGRFTGPESYALQALGAEATLRELLGARGDNRDKKLQMYQAIQRDGFVREKELVGSAKGQATLNMLNVMLLGAGLVTDLVTGEVLEAGKRD